MPEKINKDLARRTPAEELWIARKAAGLSGIAAAARAGVGKNTYYDAEAGRNPSIRAPLPGIPRVRRPTAPLLLALARRRSGLALWEVARAVQVSKVTLHAREGRGDGLLREFWSRRGFRFPPG